MSVSLQEVYLGPNGQCIGDVMCLRFRIAAETPTPLAWRASWLWDVAATQRHEEIYASRTIETVDAQGMEIVMLFRLGSVIPAFVRNNIHLVQLDFSKDLLHSSSSSSLLRYQTEASTVHGFVGDSTTPCVIVDTIRPGAELREDALRAAMVQHSPHILQHQPKPFPKRMQSLPSSYAILVQIKSDIEQDRFLCTFTMPHEEPIIPQTYRPEGFVND